MRTTSTKRQRKSSRSEAGQTAVEYMMVIAVVVIGIVAASYMYLNPFQDGVNDLATDVERRLGDGRYEYISTSMDALTGGGEDEHAVTAGDASFHQ